MNLFSSNINNILKENSLQGDLSSILSITHILSLGAFSRPCIQTQIILKGIWNNSHAP